MIKSLLKSKSLNFPKIAIKKAEKIRKKQLTSGCDSSGRGFDVHLRRRWQRRSTGVIAEAGELQCVLERLDKRDACNLIPR